MILKNATISVPLFFKQVNTAKLFRERTSSTNPSLFWVMVSKEIADQIRSMRVVILMILIGLTCLGSLYTAFSNLSALADKSKSSDAFFFLDLFTVSDGTLPSFIVFVGFLGPLMGIGLGFDAINSEHNRGTLIKLLSQPIPRDYVLNTKFVGSILVVACLFFFLSALFVGSGLIMIGIPPTGEEIARIILYTVLAIIYVGFWLNLSIFFSVRFRQAATSALAGVAAWLFFTIFYPLLTNVIVSATKPSKFASPFETFVHQKFTYLIKLLTPNEIFNQATSAVLTPSIRQLGPISFEQLHGTIPGPLPLDQSLMIIWPQLSGLVAATVVCFIASYVYFMKREIRSR